LPEFSALMAANGLKIVSHHASFSEKVIQSGERQQPELQHSELVQEANSSAQRIIVLAPNIAE